MDHTKGDPLATVLVVDDDPVALAFACDLLAETSHAVLTACDRESCLRQLFAERVAVVVMDVRLPGTDGDVLTDAIQRNLDPCPRVVLYSGLEEGELARLAAEVAAHAHVTKGEAAGRLVALVEDAVAAYERDYFATASDDLATDPPAAPAGRGRPVLVVEDCETRRYFLGDWLRERGVHPLMASDGREALRTLEGLPDAGLPELVLTDLHMPHMDGAELVDAIRADPRLAGIETLLYSTSLADAASYADGLLVHARDLSLGALDFDELLVRLEVRFSPRAEPGAAVLTASHA